MLPIDKSHLKAVTEEVGITNITTATIRQICALSKALEDHCGEEFVHLELGNPGIPAEQEGIEAEIEALRSGVANKYPDIAGIPALKKSGKEFLKAFLDIDFPEYGFVPTVGSMQGSFTMMILLSQRLPGKDTMLFINPGFPAQRHQAKLLGINDESFDIYEYRGEKLEAKLESILSKGNVTGIIYSNPNNPAWTNLTEQELEIIGRMATKYDVIVIEDLAYMGMDFRTYMGKPYCEPYIPTVAKYTDNCIILLSASKIFSYAGQRIALVCMSEQVFNRQYEFIEKFYEMPNFGNAYIFGVLYTASSGTTHSTQYGMAAMLKAAVEERLDFVDHCREYERRAGKMKKIFLDNGFHVVYSHDCDQLISDGFFFTVGYKDLTSEELQNELLRYGVSSISLPSTGSKQNGVRVCVSKVNDQALEYLATRLKLFNDEH